MLRAVPKKGISELWSRCETKRESVTDARDAFPSKAATERAAARYPRRDVEEKRRGRCEKDGDVVDRGKVRWTSGKTLGAK